VPATDESDPLFAAPESADSSCVKTAMFKLLDAAADVADNVPLAGPPARTMLSPVAEFIAAAKFRPNAELFEIET